MSHFVRFDDRSIILYGEPLFGAGKFENNTTRFYARGAGGGYVFLINRWKICAPVLFGGAENWVLMTTHRAISGRGIYCYSKVLS